jgi:hypothetical protein
LWERSHVDNSFRYIFIYRFSYLLIKNYGSAANQRHGWNIWYNEHYISKSISHAVSTLDLYHPSDRWP